DVGIANLNRSRCHCAKRVQRVRDAASRTHSKWSAARKCIHTGSLEASDDVRKDSFAHKFAVMPERQFVHVAGHQAMRCVEVAWTEPGTVVPSIRSAAGIGLQLLRCIVDAARIR